MDTLEVHGSGTEFDAGEGIMEQEREFLPRGGKTFQVKKKGICGSIIGNSAEGQEIYHRNNGGAADNGN